jgi:hypothetical protein|eukprot:TRINITY_DN9082_c0_g2_i1.p2 TRINITY_DN9082_c0_g2~~TRINITY_DN9082_c0_g2_i1.p2  ORF type:complete len:102 (-),score=15.00 TRINITY_DN9082_c0_g2_i1:80-385(-)
MLADSRLVHLLPGRCRLELPALLDNLQLARDLQRDLQALPEVRSAHCNALTGRILVEFSDEERAAPFAPNSATNLVWQTVQVAALEWMLQSSLKLAVGALL